MKKLKFLIFILTSLLTFVALGQKINDTAQWVNPSSKLQAVYTGQNGYQKFEILKLYKDNSYEFLVYYSAEKNCNMKREIGTFIIKKDKLTLIKPAKSRVNSPNYSGTYTIKPGKGLYISLFKSVFNKSSWQMQERKKTDFDFPFYLDPFTKTIINNIDAVKKIDLKDLAINITKNKTNERDKIKAIINFINNSIEYDYQGYKSGKYANLQGDSKSILAGQKRIAVCAGYAHVFEELCKDAGLSCREVSGWAKNSINDISRFGKSHAWNIVKIDGKEELYDITWADICGDKWLNVNPEVFIYTHFPNKLADQLLEDPISKEDFNNAPYIKPEIRIQSFKSFSPRSGVVFADSQFQFIVHSKVTKININEASPEIFDIVYSDEGYKKQNYILTPVMFTIKQNEHGETIITMRLKNTISAIYISIDGCEYCYKVINGSRETILKTFEMNANRQKIDSYIKGILAAIVLNDIDELIKLVGKGNIIFFDNNLKIKKEILNKFQNWDGTISQWYVTNDSHFSIDKTNSSTAPNFKFIKTDENTIYAGKSYFAFNKTDDGYAITSEK